jgi:HprK-related kinase B
MHGVPKQPRVNPGTLLNNPDLNGVLPDERVQVLQRLSKDELWELEEKYDVDIERVYGAGRWVLSAPVKAFVVLNWSRRNAGGPMFHRVDVRERPDVLELIRKGPGPFHMDAEGKFLSGKEELAKEPYIAALQPIAVYEVTGAVDFDAAAERCIEILNA